MSYSVSAVSDREAPCVEEIRLRGTWDSGHETQVLRCALRGEHGKHMAPIPSTSVMITQVYLTWETRRPGGA